MRKWLLVLSLAACATSRGGGRFPSAEDLRKLTEAPAPARLTSVSEREVDGWALAGPLPTRIETVAHDGTTPWDGLLARGPVFASESMHCLAREAGRFYLAHRALPSPQLRGFLANRCGSASADALVAYNAGNVPASSSEAEVFEHWRAGVEKWLTPQLERGPLAGIWFGRDGDHGVVMLALLPRRVNLEPLTFRPGSDGRITLRGELLVPTANLQALITQGRYGFARCTQEAEVKLPRFAVSCQVDPSDTRARIEMGAFAEGRITGPIAVDLLVWPAGEPDNAWHRTVPSLARPTAGELADNVLALVNEARGQASLAPLQLASAQSATAAKVARHYFAAVLGLEAETIADQVVLGLRAGWEIEGAIRLGHFTAGAVMSRDAAELVTAMLERPSGRETLLARTARMLAVGAFVEEDKITAGVISTYEFSDEREADVQRVIARVSELRRAAGRAAPRIIQELQPRAAEQVRRVTQGRSPQSAMQSLIELAAEWHNGGARGWAVDYLTVDELQLPPDLLNAPSLRMALAVAPYKPAGEPWTRFVLVIVAVDETLATLGRPIASR